MSAPLRVLHIDTEKTWRGGEQQALYLAQGLAQRGVEQLCVGRPGMPYVERCAAAGLHLFVEKPVSLFLDEAESMRRAIEKAGVIACAGFNQRPPFVDISPHGFQRLPLGRQRFDARDEVVEVGETRRFIVEVASGIQVPANDLLGLVAAQERAKDHMRQACDALAQFGDRATVLQDCARFIIERKA